MEVSPYTIERWCGSSDGAIFFTRDSDQVNAPPVAAIESFPVEESLI